jgi:GTPase
LTHAALVSIGFGAAGKTDVEELKQLAISAGASPVVVLTGRRASPHPALFIGSGKADELKQAIDTHDIEIIIFDHALAPIQQRNLEQKLERRVIDRTSLILDIFAQRARSYEGKLQVELAQLQYLSTRLVRAWSHLERQKGGIGLRGPGETQLETDRRLIGKRIVRLSGQLERLQRGRLTQRRQRLRRRVFSVSLVGYTNAGKTTLFNALAKTQAYTADQLFATLDTTSRRVWLSDAAQMVLSDTVGFIRALPHQLIAAFRATLAEAAEADLLLHVVDANNAARFDQIEQVRQVLREIGAINIPHILVWNKIDAAPAFAMQGGMLERDEYGSISKIFLSAQKGCGLEVLRQAIAEAAVHSTTRLQK